MKALLVLEVVLTNVITLYLYSLVSRDFAWRLAYDRSIGLTPSVSRAVFTYVMSSSNAATLIPGLPTLDWSQVLLLVLVIVDASFAISILRERRSPAS